MQWEIVIGLETHAQLSTASKMFSGASTAFGAEPNAQASAVDIALPGVLPVANRGAVERAIRLGLAVNGSINRRSVFARKNYFYPDLPKGYQVSQYELPIVQGGTVRIVSPERGEIGVRLTRAHLEEDAGKSLHEAGGDARSALSHGMSGIDLNRAGTPLLEIVSEPDMRSAEEAVAYARELHSLVRWIGICDGNMQEGSFRCDANVSVRAKGSDRLGTRREIKNLNSFRFLQQAIEYEVKWQIDRLENGGTIEQATVLFDADTGETRAMRSKEDAHDYRYFPDPDLLPLEIAEEWIERVREELPELPQAKRERYMSWGLSAYDAGVLTSSRETAEFYEDLVAALDEGRKLAASWVSGELFGALKRAGLEISQSPVSSRQLADLLRQIQGDVISGKIAKEVFDTMWHGGGEVEAIIAAKGLTQISDSGELERIIDEILAKNPGQVAEYRAGRDKALNFLVGQAMKATRGKGNPGRINEILKRKLSG